MKILHHCPGIPQEPACPACSLGAEGIVITDGDADDPCELMRIVNLAYWFEDVNAYMQTCPTVPSSLPERKMLTFALAFRGAGAGRQAAEDCLLEVRRGATEPVPSVAKTRELVRRAYELDGAEWQGLQAYLGGGATP